MSPLHSIICVLLTVLPSLHIIHTRVCLMHDVWLIRWETRKMGDVSLSCVPGGTKSLSTSTRSGVRRYAVYESVHTQQTPLKVHVETGAGLLRNQGPKIFREVEIVPRCAVSVAGPSCPDCSPVFPGPGRVIRNMLGWSRLEKTNRSGVWLFRGALRGRICFLLLTQLETG